MSCATLKAKQCEKSIKFGANCGTKLEPMFVKKYSKHCIK